MQIQIKGINTHTIIGCYPDERLNKQDLIINLQVDLYNYNWLDDDRLDTTVNYDELAIFVKQIVEATSFKLLETLAEFLANELLAKFKLIMALEVELIKPAICGKLANHIQVNYQTKRLFEVAIALGSNNEYLPVQQLITAIELLGEYISDIKIGGFYKTKPVGYLPQPDFYNTAIVGYTNLKPEELLGKMKTIEKLMGKHELVINGPRIIDLDLILFADLIYQHNFLSVPHKACHLRDFVLKPLIDINPNLIHPDFKLTLMELYKQLAPADLSIVEEVDKNIK